MINEYLEFGTKQLSYKYRKDTPGQTTNGKTMKREKFIPKNIIDEDVPAFMGALAQAAKDGKKEFEFGGKTFKVKLKKDVVDKITKNMDESEDLDDLFVDSLISDLVEAAAADYAKLSDSELKDLFDIFKNVGRSAAKPVITAIKREMEKRSMKEEVELEEAIKVKTHRGMYSMKKGEESLRHWVDGIVIMSDAVKKNQRKTVAQNIVKAIESGKIKNADLTQDLGALIGIKSPKGMEAPANIVKAKLKDLGLSESTELEEAMKWWTVTITKKAGKLFKGQTVDVKARNSAEAIKKGIKQMKGDPMTVPSGSVDAVLGESTNLEEAVLPFKELEKAWIRTKGNDKKREKLIKKHNLKPIISNVRPGAIKLGPLNALNAKGKQNYTMAGLDLDGELIFISNNPTRIHYPSNVKDRPKGEEMKESVSLETLRLRKVIQLSVNESDEKLIDSFIAESNVDISWAPSKIANTFNKFTKEL